jgi:hypothetical protein
VPKASQLPNYQISVDDYVDLMAKIGYMGKIDLKLIA